MLHPLNPPSCIAELETLIGLQRKVLEYAASATSYSDAGLVTAVGSDLGNWIIVRPPTDRARPRFVDRLRDLITLSPKEKTDLIDAFDHDQTYYAELDNPGFRFSFPPKNDPALGAAGACIGYFYDFLGVGFPAKVASPTNPGFRKTDVIQGTKNTNPWVEHVCPSCDSLITEVQGANAEGYTLEHYFQKEQYPSICLHPLNLVPMCSRCNTVKSNNDPLAPGTSPTFKPPLFNVPYDEVFHPFKRPVRNHADLRFIPVPGTFENMEFVSLNISKPYSNSIRAYGQLYGIPRRWQELHQRIDHRVTMSIKRAINAFTYEGAKLDLTLFQKAVELALLDLEESITQDHFSYPAARWLRWAKQNKFDELWRGFNTS